MFKLLSIDGGGIRGVIPARILAEIEKRTSKRIYEMFDLITGTSTGGIIALGLVCPAAADGLPYTAESLLRLYQQHGLEIFPPAGIRWARKLKNYFRPKYSPAGLEKQLQAYFREFSLKDSLKDVLIPSYEIERRTPFFFKSRKSKLSPEFDYPMRDVARATSAAPTYFPPHQIDIPNIFQRFAWVDGGIFANNPTLCGYVEVKKNYEDANNIFILSIGTGVRAASLGYELTKNWGEISWAQPVIDMAFDGVSNTVDYQMQELQRRDKNLHYLRLQVSLDQGFDRLDDARPEKVRGLLLKAEELIRNEQDTLERLYDILSPPLVPPNGRAPSDAP